MRENDYVWHSAMWMHLLGKRRCQKPLINAQNIILKMQQTRRVLNHKCKRLAGDNNKVHFPNEFTMQTITGGRSACVSASICVYARL